MRADIEEALWRYGKEGMPVGDFLQAVLANDLFSATGRADEDNMRDLKEIVQYVYNELPMICVGSREKYRFWITQWNDERRKANVREHTPTP